MKRNVIKQFERCYPSIAEDVEEYIETNDDYIIVRLIDGSAFLYSSWTNAIRQLPKDSYDMTEEQCKKEFGHRLRMVMQNRGITQVELSIRTGITQPSISAYMNGIKCPSFYTVDRIAKALDCSVDVFRYFGR